MGIALLLGRQNAAGEHVWKIIDKNFPQDHRLLGESSCNFLYPQICHSQGQEQGIDVSERRDVEHISTFPYFSVGCGEFISAHTGPRLTREAIMLLCPASVGGHSCQEQIQAPGFPLISDTWSSLFRECEAEHSPPQTAWLIPSLWSLLLLWVPKAGSRMWRWQALHLTSVNGSTGSWPGRGNSRRGSMRGAQIVWLYAGPSTRAVGAPP